MSANEFLDQDYKYGFYTDIETEDFPKGLNEDIVRLISKKKEEPEWLLEYRLKAFRHWKTLTPPKSAKHSMATIARPPSNQGKI